MQLLLTNDANRYCILFQVLVHVFFTSPVFFSIVRGFIGRCFFFINSELRVIYMLSKIVDESLRIWM